MGSAGGEELDGLLDEQAAYYRAIAAEYLDHLDLPGGDEVREALDAFRPAGNVLELACGPGVWTGQLLRHASHVTAVDASVVFIGFWLSHVPPERFGSFWSFVADCLEPDGRVFFADDGHRTHRELVKGPSSATIRRELRDGTSYRLVKVPYRPVDLEKQLRRLGWQVKVTPTSGAFYWGAGRRG